MGHSTRTRCTRSHDCPKVSKSHLLLFSSTNVPYVWQEHRSGCADATRIDGHPPCSRCDSDSLKSSPVGQSRVASVSLDRVPANTCDETPITLPYWPQGRPVPPEKGKAREAYLHALDPAYSPACFGWRGRLARKRDTCTKTSLRRDDVTWLSSGCGCGRR